MATQQVTRISAYGILTRANQLLLCRLSSQVLAGAGMWTLPGGDIEFGEDPKDAMIREVEEETGLNVVSTGLAGVHSFRLDSPKRSFHGIQLIYHATILGGRLRHEVSGSTDQCAGHALDALDSLPVVELVDAALPMISGRSRA